MLGVAAVLLAPRPVVSLGEPGAAVFPRIDQPGQALIGQRLLELLGRPKAQLTSGVRTPAERDAGGVDV